jgi:ABC-type antimicrobial peptide transport system permease subunit
MVNERLARRFWPHGDAVGQRIKYGKMAWSTIVGVVADVEIPGVRDRARLLQLYMPISTAPTRATLVFRSTLPVFRLDSLVQGIVRDAAPGATTGTPIVADELLRSARQVQHSLLQVLGAFAVIALLLAAIGLHAVIAFSVGQRTREIGMRVALGAAQSDVVRLVMRQGLTLALWGVAIGVAGALASARALSSFLYGVEPRDPLTVAAVGALLAVVAVVASLPPAWRAARIDPIEALRAD